MKITRLSIATPHIVYMLSLTYPSRVVARQDVVEPSVMKQGEGCGQEGLEYEGEWRRYLGSRGRLDRA